MKERTKYVLGLTPRDESKREKRDYYATSPEATRLLLKHEKFNKKILEPCAGGGYVSKVLLKKGYEVVSTDLYDYGFGVAGVDFLDTSNSLINGLVGDVDIVTNVPYTHAVPMLIRALQVCKNKVAMLFPLSYIPKFYFCPPTKIYVFPRRIGIAKNGDFSTYQRGNMSEFAWFVWYKGARADTVIKYIDNVKKTNTQLQPYIAEADDMPTWNATKEGKKGKIQELYKQGMRKREIARIVGVSESCVRKWLKEVEK